MGEKKRVDTEILQEYRDQLEVVASDLIIFLNELQNNDPLGGTEIDIDILKYKARKVKNAADELLNIRIIR